MTQGTTILSASPRSQGSIKRILLEPMLRCTEEREVIWDIHYGFTKVKSSLTNLVFYVVSVDVIAAVDKGRARDGSSHVPVHCGEVGPCGL